MPWVAWQITGRDTRDRSTHWWSELKTFKWSKKAAEELNTDCSMTAELKAVLQVAVVTHVMLPEIQTLAKGWSMGLYVLLYVLWFQLRPTTFVHFDNMSDVYDVDQVRSKFMVMKNITVSIDFGIWKNPVYTSAKVSHWLECAMIDLSHQVFFVGFSHVKWLGNYIRWIHR